MVVFIALILMLLLSWLIPQSPVPPTDHVMFSRWLAETRTTLGDAADVFETLGLFNLRSSLWMRLLLVWLSLIGTVRMTTLAERWSQLTHLQRGVQSVIVGGAVAILIGWMLQTGFSWSETNLIAWTDQVTIPNRELTLAAPDGPIAWCVDQTYGLFLVAQGKYAQGVEVRAEDNLGQPLPLHTSSHSAPNDSLNIALAQERPDVYFALPEAELGFRISLQSETEAIYVQVYRFASGALITDTVFQDAGDIAVADVHVYLERIPYTRFALVYNPGAPLIGLGLLLLGAGSVTLLVLGKGGIDRPSTVVENDVEEATG